MYSYMFDLWNEKFAKSSEDYCYYELKQFLITMKSLFGFSLMYLLLMKILNKPQNTRIELD
jgi:hypothetical protein